MHQPTRQPMAFAVNCCSQPQRPCQSGKVMFRIGASWKTVRNDGDLASPVFVRTLQGKLHPLKARQPAHTRACGEIDRAASAFLPNLRPGEAAVIGTDFPIPLTIQIGRPTIQPKSDGPNYQQAWGTRFATKSSFPGEFKPPPPNPPPNPKEPQTPSALPDATEKPRTPAPARPPLPLSALSGARVGERSQPPALSRQRIRHTRPLRCAAGRDCRLPHQHAARIKRSSPAASKAWHRDSLIRDR